MNTLTAKHTIGLL